jgi:DNA sulfur modification protein DndB
LIKLHPTDWAKRLKKLENIDWSKTNSSTWEGRALIGGRVTKVTANISLTTNIIKKELKIPLELEEEKFENAFSRRSK